MFVRCFNRQLEARTAENEARQARRRESTEARNARVKQCPNCFVPIEKNDGCDHMHCTVCGSDFSWRNATPWDFQTYFHHLVSSQFRLCPYCHQQNEKLHNLSEARCSRCRRDFIWENARLAPQPRLHIDPSAPPTSPPPDANAIMEPRQQSDCGSRCKQIAETTPALRAWLDHHQTAGLNSESEELVDIPEFAKCAICSTRRKSHALPCGHLFCEVCLVTMLSDNPTCPVDRAVVNVPPMKIYL